MLNNTYLDDIANRILYQYCYGLSKEGCVKLRELVYSDQCLPKIKNVIEEYFDINVKRDRYESIVFAETFYEKNPKA
jgi:hypothetical protein